MTDSTGTIVGEQRYYPYGETRLTTGTIYTDKLFTGQRDVGLGIYHFGARIRAAPPTLALGASAGERSGAGYSPKLGRFLSADTDVPASQGVQGYDRYSYVSNNPLRYTDPTGHVAIGDTNEAGCSGYGPACIIAMYYAAGDDDGLDRSLEAFAKRHPKYNPSDDPELEGTNVVIVAAAYSRVGCDGGSAWDCVALGIVAGLSAPGLVPPAPSVSTDGDFYTTTVSCSTVQCTQGIDDAFIGIPADRLQHVIDRHTVGGSATKNASIFSQNVNLVDLIQQAGPVPSYPQGNGRFERIVDAGKIIGIDRYTGRPTSIYTVITDSSGNLVTAFPGVPHP